MITVRRTPPPNEWSDSMSVRRALLLVPLGGIAHEYQLRDEYTGFWLASFEHPDELDAAVDMVVLRFNAKEVP